MTGASLNVPSCSPFLTALEKGPPVHGRFGIWFDLIMILIKEIIHDRTFAERHGLQHTLFPALGNLARAAACRLGLRDVCLAELSCLCPLGNRLPAVGILISAIANPTVRTRKHEVVSCSVAADPNPTLSKSALQRKRPAWKHWPPRSNLALRRTDSSKKSSCSRRHPT